MGLRIYERNNYVCHNHGIIELLLLKDIGKVTFSYQRLMPEYHASALKKEEYVDLVMRGEFFQSLSDGLFYFKEPITATAKLTQNDIQKLKSVSDLNENVSKIIEYCSVKKYDDYEFRVELRGAY